MAHSTTYKRVMGDIANGFITEGSIRGFRKALHNPGSTKLTDNEAGAIFDAIIREYPRITDAQAEKGYKWLMNLWKTPTGRERKNNPFNAFEQNVLRDFSHFSLVDFKEIYNGYRSVYYPIYKVHAKHGASFVYYATPCQAGGQLEILHTTY